MCTVQSINRNADQQRAHVRDDMTKTNNNLNFKNEKF